MEGEPLLLIDLQSKREQLPKAVDSWMISYLCVACVHSGQVFFLSDACLQPELLHSATKLACSNLWSFLLLLGVSLGERGLYGAWNKRGVTAGSASGRQVLTV